jgi:predicted DNA binding CopG/RHH family protein
MTMPKKPMTIPKFSNTDEEANWWESREGKRAATELMKHAVDTGKVRRRKVMLKTVTMRLPEPDIETAKDLAFRKGLPYQTYIKMLLHEAIEKERRSA